MTRCSVCDREVPGADPQASKVVCYRCLMRRGSVTKPLNATAGEQARPMRSVLVECCNFKDDACLHIDLRPCGVVQGGRCGFFERAVLPGLKPDGVGLTRRAYAPGQTVSVVDQLYAAIRKCPDCGGPLPKRHQFCESCQEKRQRAANRDRQRANGVLAHAH